MICSTADIKDTGMTAVKKKDNKKSGGGRIAPVKRVKGEDFPAEFDDIRDRNPKKHKRPNRNIPRNEKTVIAKPFSKFMNPVAEYLPIVRIANGVIYTKDHRFVKIIEVEPINFLLRSAREQRSIIYSFKRRTRK
jgi:hypothetical protein